MMKRIVKSCATIALSLSLVLQGLTFIAPKQASAFNANSIISDGVFENVNSMGAPQIDHFLNSIGGSCIRQLSGFLSPDPLGYSGGAYQFGGGVTAGQALYNIGNRYRINPQVLLTTLQKEQSIVTGGAGCRYDRPNPNDPAQVFPCALYGGSRMYRCTEACPWSYGGGCMYIAMGYGCPGNCNVDTQGFHMQISAASWMLRFAEMRSYGVLSGYPGFDPGDETYSYSGPMTPGHRQRTTGGANIYYDGYWTTNDGVGVVVSNGATASLYSYTPFISGNSKFVNIFENTFRFGNTQHGGCVGNETPGNAVSRFYHPRTFQHFYTAYGCDIWFLLNLGYVYAGPVMATTASNSPNATPVYRYYNPTTRQHMWSTENKNQAQLNADGTGYQVEAGVVFYVDSPNNPGAAPVYRFYNPRTFLHVWASSRGLTVNDLGIISRAGYHIEEGAAWYTQ